MKNLYKAIPGAAIAGLMVVTSITPAVADSKVSSEQVSAQVSKSAKLKKMKSITSNSKASTARWFDTYSKKNKPSVKKYKFNWKTDGCSWAPDKIAGGYDFHNPCWRHDFGYRNYKKTVGKTAFRRDHKLRIDKAFLTDMRQVCNWKPWADPYTPAMRKKLKKSCNKTANKYYQAVRSFN
ncbi:MULTISPECIES: phospholipase A2 [Streptomyces]|uniref:Phospholipase n=1 Tax=Streptomyces silvensis TaxID=1765722 RepID=A0A0W7X980_9ACTN|nr:phospholipase A2 [Streptomyces silvensis]KUF19516.1 hypothetical protein AT728_03800 [Streptomyces silvensis]